MPTTRELVENVWNLGPGNLEYEDLRSLSLLTLDFLGVAARGSVTPSAAAMRRFTKLRSQQGTSPVIGTRATADPVAASMMNAVAAHSIEYDDVHNASSSHPGVVVLPTALAIADMVEATGTSFLLAVIRGYEVMCRVGRAVNPTAHYARHFHPTGTIGHFGSAITAASLLQLDEDQTVAAVGIAATMAAGSMQFLMDGAWTKRLHPALAARNGIEAALLAASGYKGTQDGICGARGFLNAYSASPQPEELLADWGSRSLEVRNTSIKAHTCCRYMQGPIDAVLQLRKDHDLDAEDVIEVNIGIPSVAEDIIWRPVDRKRRPATIVDSQFSMPYGAAVALLRGKASLDEFDGSLLYDKNLHRLMDVTWCVIDPKLDKTYPQQWQAWVEVTTKAGLTVGHEVTDPKGDPANPLSSEEVVAKFCDLTAGLYSKERQDLIVKATAEMSPNTLEPRKLLAIVESDT